MCGCQRCSRQWRYRELFEGYRICCGRHSRNWHWHPHTLACPAWPGVPWCRTRPAPCPSFPRLSRSPLSQKGSWWSLWVLQDPCDIVVVPLMAVQAVYCFMGLCTGKLGRISMSLLHLTKYWATCLGVPVVVHPVEAPKPVDDCRRLVDNSCLGRLSCWRGSSRSVLALLEAWPDPRAGSPRCPRPTSRRGPFPVLLDVRVLRGEVRGQD